MRSWIFVLLVAGGCGSATQPPTGDDAGSDAGLADAVAPDSGVPPATDLGRSCAFGCNLETCADTSSTSCSTHICVADDRGARLETYCSQRCDSAPCPAAYRCVASADGEGRFCFAEPATCGDGIVQRGEVCDGAGRPPADSGCASDCRMRVSGGSATLTIDGVVMSFSGTSTSPGTSRVEADTTSERGFLTATFGGTSPNPRLELGIELARIPATLPATVSSFVSFWQSENSCPRQWRNPWLTFINGEWTRFAAVIRVESWDGRRMVGSFDGTLRAQENRIVGSTCLNDRPPRIVTASRFELFLAAP